MANPYYNTGTNHSDFTQGHAMPQSPFQQTLPGTTTATQHLYQHSPYAVHTLPPHGPTTAHHPGYTTTSDHGVLQYASAMQPHSHDTRWVDEAEMLEKYRQDQPPPDYEIDQHQDHHQQQQQQQLMQVQTHPAQESQTHAPLQPPVTSISNHPEPMSPATRPSVIKTGASFSMGLSLYD
jgi:hypothetical protein